MKEKPLSAMVEVYQERRQSGLAPLVIGGCAVLLQAKLVRRGSGSDAHAGLLMAAP